MGYDTPRPPGDGIKLDEVTGHALFIEVTGKRIEMPTANGPADALVAHVVDLDTGQVFDDTLLFGRALNSQLAVGGKYAGRIIKGQAQAGKNAPWTFVDDPQVYPRADAYQASRQAAAYQAPQAPPAPPAAPANPWGQPQPGQPGAPAYPPAGWGPPPTDAPPAAPWGGAPAGPPPF